jgi:hypothetical protein
VVLPILFWLITMYPAVLTGDSYEVLKQITNPDTAPQDSAYLTPAFVIFSRIFSFGGHFLPGIVIVQSALIYSALFMWVNILIPRPSKESRLLVTGLMFLTPFFGALAVTIWKDVPYIAFTMIGLALLTKLSSEKKMFSYFFGGGLLAFGATFRYEGFVVLFASAVILIMCHCLYKKIFGFEIYLKFAFIFLMSAVLSILISLSLNKITDLQAPSNFYKTQGFFLDLEFANSNFPESLPLEIRDVLQKISAERTLVGMKACANPQNFYHSDFDLRYAESEWLNIPKYWLKALSSDAREAILVSRICRTSSVLPVPLSFIPQFGYWPTTGMGPNILRPDRPLIIERFVYPIGWAWSQIWWINGNLIGWPGLHLSIIITFLIFRFRGVVFGNSDMKNAIMIIPLTFLVARSLILFWTVTGQEFRYFAHVYFISIPLLLGFLLNILRVPKHLGK